MELISLIIGKKIRSLRIGQGKSMTTLAHESDMEYVQLSRIELGKINTSFIQIYKILKNLNINISDFLKLVEEDLKIELEKQKK